MFRVKQRFARSIIAPENIPGELAAQLSFISDRIRPGMRVAITAGSRGIANVALITGCIAQFVNARGAYPFIVPAWLSDQASHSLSWSLPKAELKMMAIGEEGKISKGGF